MEKFVPFPERVRWMMLKAAINHGCTASAMTRKLGWPRHKVLKTVMANRANVRMSDVAEWFYAVNPGIKLDFKLVLKP